MIGLILHEYPGYTLDKMRALSPFQFAFLQKWLEWFYSKVGGK